MTIIEEQIQESAWYQGRNVDISFVGEDLKRANIYPTNEKVANFLIEFIFIELILPRSYHVRFNIDDTIRFIDRKLIETLNEIAKDILVPISIINEGSALLFMSYCGNFYMLLSNELHLLGSNMVNFLEKIIDAMNLA
jgi:hypothetical protein